MLSSPVLRRWFSSLSPWLAAITLLAMSEAPSIALSQPLRVSVDMAVLLAGYVASLRLPAKPGRIVRLLMLLYTLLLIAFRLDRTAMLAFMGQEPLIYDQVLMARHLFVLFGDLWSPKLGATLAAMPVLIALLVWIVRRLLQKLTPFSTSRSQAIASAIALGLLCATPALSSHIDALAVVSPTWVTPDLIDNLKRSRDVYTSVQHALRKSPYRAYDQLKLGRRPDIYLFIVESYGRVTVDHSAMYYRWRSRIRHMEATLDQAGWSSASAFTVAPVAGGRSWLADATLLTGIHVDYEAVFHHLVGQIDRVPNLVSLLARQGYHTLMLAPSDRVRKGVEEVNYYKYDRVLRFHDLDYHGPKMGWGLVPDQYSLGFADEHFVQKAQRPLFFSFHMVTSHTPFRPVPKLVDDWRSLSDPNAPPLSEEGNDALGMRMRRYAYRTPRFMPMGNLRRDMAYSYTAAVLYDLSLLERYLTTLPGDALVIVMGDHQPPFIAPETNNFESILHVFARDPELLREFREHGFKQGLELSPNDQAAVQHEGLFSLLVRTLSRCCAREPFEVKYMRDGTRF